MRPIDAHQLDGQPITVAVAKRPSGGWELRLEQPVEDVLCELGYDAQQQAATVEDYGPTYATSAVLDHTALTALRDAVDALLGDRRFTAPF